MKIGGKSNFKTTRVVDISREGMDLAVTVTTLPLSFSKQMQELFPMPTPPLKNAYKKDGSLKKLPDGSPEKCQNLEDKEYKAAIERNSIMQAVYMFWLATREDGNIEWTHKLDQKNLKTEDFEKLWHEAEEAGLTMGDMARVMEAATEMSNLDIKNISDAED